MTEVFKAKSFGVEGFEKTLVIKRVLPELSAEADFVANFVREAQLSVRLSHSSVVQVFDLGRVDEAVGTSFYMAMELVQGFNLTRLLQGLRRAKRSLPIGLALYLASELAKALDHAHRRRDEHARPLEIIHGDLSPGNVLISWEGEVKLSDFGIGRAYFSLGERADANILARKFAYASPEQAKGEPLGPASDLFALGVLSYELFTGVSPFKAASKLEVIERVSRTPPRPVHQLNDDVSLGVSTLVSRLLSPEPAARGESAGRVYEEFLAELYASGSRMGAFELSVLLEELADQPFDELPAEEPQLELSIDSQVSGLVSAPSPTLLESGVAADGPVAAAAHSTSAEVAEPTASEIAASSALIGAPSSHGERPRRSSAPRVKVLDDVVFEEELEDAVASGPYSSSGPLATTGAALKRGAPQVVLPEVSAQGQSASVPPKKSAGIHGAVELPQHELTVLLLKLPQPSAQVIERARGTMARYAARVIQEQPSELIALFGLDEADGRDAELAVRAGLVLARSLSAAQEKISIGIHDIRWGGGAPEELASSELLAPARRLLDGPAYGLLLSDSAAKHVNQRFDLEQLEQPGASEPIWCVRALLEAKDAYGRFVGRQDELKQLGSVLARASRRQLQVVGVVGEYGIGKSRLLFEMVRRIERGEFKIRCHIAECIPSGKHLPYSGILALLRTLCGVQEGDPPARIEAVEPRLRALGLHDEEVGVVLGELGLIKPSRDMTAGLLKNAVSAMFDGLAKDQLHVFCWDNAQDLDHASVELLSGAITRLQRARVILLFAARPLGATAYKKLPGYTELSLGALPDDDIYRLICVRLGVREIPSALLAFVQQRSAGHPMFVEELLREALESGAILVADKQLVKLDLAGALSVPRPLRSLLGDRVRRLDESERQLLVGAAILGAPVDTSVLSEVTRLSLSAVHRIVERLEAKQLVSRVGPVALAIRSPLLAEVVLAELSDDERAEFHYHAATAYQVILGEGSDAGASRIARHLAEAGQADRAAGYYAQSGIYQFGAQRLEQAVMDLAQALSLADWDARGGEQLAEWVRVLAQAVRHVRSGAGLAELVSRLAQRIEQDTSLDLGARVAASVDLALSLGALHRYKEARQLLQRVSRLEGGVEGLSPERVRSVFAAESEICFRQGNFREAVAAIHKALASRALDALEQHRLQLLAAQALAGAGELVAAQRALDAASQLVPDGDQLVLQSERAKVRALIRAFQRDWGGAALAAEQAAELGRAAGLRHEVAVNLHNQGDSLMRLNELPRAYAAFQSSLEVAQGIGSERMVNLNQMMLAYLDASKGSLSARKTMGERLALAEEQRWVWDIVTGRYLLGKLLAEQGDTSGARRELQLALRLAQEAKNRLLSEDCAEQLEALS